MAYGNEGYPDEPDLNRKEFKDPGGDGYPLLPWGPSSLLVQLVHFRIGGNEIRGRKYFARLLIHESDRDDIPPAEIFTLCLKWGEGRQLPIRMKDINSFLCACFGCELSPAIDCVELRNAIFDAVRAETLVASDVRLRIRSIDVPNDAKPGAFFTNRFFNPA